MSEWIAFSDREPPKDGTWVLLTGGKTTEDLYSWENKDCTSRPVVAFWDKSGGDEWDNWAICYWDSAWRTTYQSPTHWMPLPDPVIAGQ